MSIDDQVGERVEQALVRATARGIDLNPGKPPPWFEDYEPHTDAPRRREVRASTGPDDTGDPGIPGVYSAEGRQTRTSVNRSLPKYELAYAAAQMDPLEVAAFLWCVNGDAIERRRLRYELLVFALERKERESWPKKIRRADCEITGLVRCPYHYVLDLVTIALHEGHNPRELATEAARAKFFGVTDRHWRRSALAGGYGAIRANLVNWFNNGAVHLARLLVARAA